MNDKQFRTVVSNEDRICCPVCGSYYVHQLAVEVFTRAQEDAPSDILLTLNNVEAFEDQSPAEPVRTNPSERRQGLLIHFECEMCDDLRRGWVLAIYQHKGVSFLEWRER